jgi:hypothetical protein
MNRKPISEFVLKRLADHQIQRLIVKGVEVERLKKEWYRRWKLEYPYTLTISGIRKEY